MKFDCKKEMALLLTLLALTAGCGREAPPAEEGKIPVAASFGAMEKLTEAIGGDAVSISIMVPEGIEPHDFEPRAGDLIRLKQARVFVYNGMGMEHWADKALQSAGAENQVVVRASENVVPIPLEDEEEREEHGDYDPHTWLGLSEAKEEARAIRDGLIAASPENRDLFMKNYDTFAKSIDSLQQEYREKLAKAPGKNWSLATPPSATWPGTSPSPRKAWKTPSPPENRRPGSWWNSSASAALIM